MVALWALLVVLAARLPSGLLKDLAGFLPVIGPLDAVVVVALTCAMRPGGSPARCCWSLAPRDAPDRT